MPQNSNILSIHFTEFLAFYADVLSLPLPTQ